MVMLFSTSTTMVPKACQPGLTPTSAIRFTALRALTSPRCKAWLIQSSKKNDIKKGTKRDQRGGSLSWSNGDVEVRYVKTVLFYFTGTGNSLAITRKIAEGLTDVTIVPMLKGDVNKSKFNNKGYCQ